MVNPALRVGRALGVCLVRRCRSGRSQSRPIEAQFNRCKSNRTASGNNRTPRSRVRPQLGRRLAQATTRSPSAAANQRPAKRRAQNSQSDGSLPTPRPHLLAGREDLLPWARLPEWALIPCRGDLQHAEPTQDVTARKPRLRRQPRLPNTLSSNPRAGHLRATII